MLTISVRPPAWCRRCTYSGSCHSGHFFNLDTCIKWTLCYSPKFSYTHVNDKLGQPSIFRALLVALKMSAFRFHCILIHTYVYTQTLNHIQLLGCICTYLPSLVHFTLYTPWTLTTHFYVLHVCTYVVSILPGWYLSTTCIPHTCMLPMYVTFILSICHACILLPMLLAGEE
jgi:hypothetical protein